MEEKLVGFSRIPDLLTEKHRKITNISSPYCRTENRLRIQIKSGLRSSTINAYLVLYVCVLLLVLEIAAKDLRGIPKVFLSNFGGALIIVTEAFRRDSQTFWSNVRRLP
jgi:hypothetical protein